MTPHCKLLTFHLKVDVILADSQAVPGHTGVFAAVVSLSRAHLQSAVVVDDVRVSIQGAGATVFKPETQKHPLEPFKEIPWARSSVRFTHQVILGMGDPKEAQSMRAR